MLAENLDNTGEYVWDTTTVADGEYKLQIVVKDEEAEAADISEGFTIENNVYPWDVNNDGVVDIADLALVGSHFGETGEGIVGDVNSDSVIDIADFELVGNHFGEQTTFQ